MILGMLGPLSAYYGLIFLDVDDLSAFFVIKIRLAMPCRSHHGRELYRRFHFSDRYLPRVASPLGFGYDGRLPLFHGGSITLSIFEMMTTFFHEAPNDD